MVIVTESIDLPRTVLSCSPEPAASVTVMFGDVEYPLPSLVTVIAVMTPADKVALTVARSPWKN